MARLCASALLIALVVVTGGASCDGLPVDGGLPPTTGAGDGDGDPAPDAGARDAGPLDVGPLDAGPLDAGPLDAGPLDAGGRTDDAGPPADGGVAFDPGAPPGGPLLPMPGELSIHQLYLPAIQIGLTPPLGEAAILVGPDGTLLLLDVGNSVHDDEVRDRVRQLNTEVLTPARGYAARDPLQVEYVVLTHFHSDHVGAFERLVTDGDEPLNGLLAVVHRGFTDVGAGVTESDFEEVCGALSGPLADVDVPLCDADVLAPCDPDAWAGAYPTTGCPGLPLELDLGGGATLTVIGASGHATDGESTEALTFGTDDNGQENARSLAGVVSFGDFRYHLGGDMTGSGEAGEPDVETHLVTVGGDAWYGAFGVDVVHGHHHMRNSSSNEVLVEALAPHDGRTRHVVGGINPAHLGSPQVEVLSAWGDDGRLAEGRIWVTHVTVGGADHPLLEDADGEVVVRTIRGGEGYWVQAVPDDGAAPWAMAAPSVRRE